MAAAMVPSSRAIGAIMSDISQPLTDTSDMPALHAVFRKSFAAAPELIVSDARR